MTSEPKKAPHQYLGFTITPDFKSPYNGRLCATQQGWQTSHLAFPWVERYRDASRAGSELGWAPTLTKAKSYIDEFIATAKAGQLTAKRRDTYMMYFPNEPRPMARDELAPEQQREKNLADAMQAEWEADKKGGAEILAGHLLEWAREQCDENASDDVLWDDEQTLEVLEAAIALVRRRHAPVNRA